MKFSTALAAVLAAGLTVQSVSAGPFEKAGLKKSTGKVLTSKQADKVRGGFRGDFGAVLDALGIDRSQGWRAVRAQIQEIGKDKIQETAQSLGLSLGRGSRSGELPSAEQRAAGREALLSRLGIDASASPEEIRAQLQSVGRQNIRAAGEGLGLANGARSGGRGFSRIQGRR